MTKPANKRLRLTRLALGIVWLSPFPLAWLYFYRYESWHRTTCIYKSITGSDCSFCGLTRAFANASHGQFSAANQFNISWPLFAGLILLIASSCLWAALTGNDFLLSKLRSLWQKYAWKILALIVIATVLL